MKKGKCAKCGGILLLKKIDYDKKVGEKRMLFENVPTLVCSSCDEIWLDGKIVEKMERVFQKGVKPTRWISIPVWSFPKAA